MIVGTRGSQLALAQTKQVCEDLSKITKEHIDIEIIKTKGDKITTSQLYNMDSKGLFTKELDIALGGGSRFYCPQFQRPAYRTG